MRRRLAAPGALLLIVAVGASCAAGPSLPVPETSLPLSTQPPPPRAAPAAGPFDSTTSRDVRLIVASGGRRVELRAWCRVGVWTTLQRVRARDFVVREAWGRLGERPPRLLLRVKDQVLGGVVARLRPERDGALSFHVEIASASVGPARAISVYHGQRVALPDPQRRGYRFSGRAPKGWTGPVARWGEHVAVHLGEDGGDAPPRRTVRFSALAEQGFVAGATPAAETFQERWEPGEPRHVVADGIERMEFRLSMKRMAAGFQPGASGRLTTYGPRFELKGR